MSQSGDNSGVGRLPDSNRLVDRTGDDLRSVVRHRNRSHDVGVSRKLPDFRPVSRIPQPHDLVGSRRQDAFAVGQERDAGQWGRRRSNQVSQCERQFARQLSGITQQQRVRSEVERDSVKQRRCGYRSRRQRGGSTLDNASFPQLASGFPNAVLAVGRAAGDSLAVSAERDRADRSQVAGQLKQGGTIGRVVRRQ